MNAQSNPKRAKRWLIAGAMAVGAMIGAAGIAGAATSSTTSAPASQAPPSNTARPGGAPGPGDPAAMANGPGETLLTGTTADKVKAAALAAVPGATVVRVETDSAGSPYEAHLKKADGSYVTLKIDGSFAVTATQPGFGGGPANAPSAAPSA